MSYLSLNGVNFAKLSVTDRNRLLQQFKGASRAAKLQDAKDAGLSSDQTWAELAVFDAYRWGYGKFCVYLDCWEGQDAVLRRAIEKANPGANVDELLGKITEDSESVLKFCCELTGVPWSPPKIVPPNMKQIGVVDGNPVYIAVDGKAPESTDTTDVDPLTALQNGGDETNPTSSAPKLRGYGT